MLRNYYKYQSNKRELKYIKVLELHKSGFIHYHVVFEHYLPVSVIRSLWQNAIWHYIKCIDTPGNVHVKKLKHANQAANYLAKYVVKAANEVKKSLKRRTRLYSKTNNIILFGKKESTDSWHYENLSFLNANLEIHRISVILERRLEQKMEIIEQSCFKKYLFDLEVVHKIKFDYLLEH